MADKSCKNCGYEGCPVDKGTTTCCDNWQPNPPPTPNEVIRARANIIDGQDIGTVEINLNNSPELVAWARSQALEFVEIDEVRLHSCFGDGVHSVEEARVITTILKRNPLKLKTK